MMEKIIKILLYLIFFQTGLLLSCSEEVKPDPLTYTKIFTGNDHKSWSIQNLIFKQVGKGDISYNLDPCITDNQYIFYANVDRKYMVLNGASKCNTTDPDVLVDDSWSFVNATATLTIDISILGTSALPFFVRSVDSDQMVLEIFTDQDNTSSYRVYFKANQN